VVGFGFVSVVEVVVDFEGGDVFVFGVEVGVEVNLVVEVDAEMIKRRNNMNICERMREARKLYGPNEKMAWEIGCSVGTIQNICSGKEPKYARIRQAVLKWLDEKGVA